MPTDGWQATDTLRFHVPPAPQTADYNLTLGVRVTDRIAVRDLWLVMEQRTLHRQRDTLHLLLASDRAHWQTKGNILHELEEPASRLHLDSAQEADILIYHIMSPQSLPGLTEVGLKVASTPPK